MADEIAVPALVRKRAELAGRIAHARSELDGMLESLVALDAMLRLFDPGIRVEAIRPKAHRPGNGATPSGIGETTSPAPSPASDCPISRIASRPLAGGKGERR